MDDALLDEGEEAVADLPKHIDRLLLITLVAAFDVLGEVAIAELLNDVVIFGALHDVVEHDDIFGVQLLEDLDLVFEGSLEIIVMVDWVG